MAATDSNDCGHRGGQSCGGSNLASNFRFRAAELYWWCHRWPDSGAGLGVFKADPAEKVKCFGVVFLRFMIFWIRNGF